MNDYDDLRKSESANARKVCDVARRRTSGNEIVLYEKKRRRNGVKVQKLRIVSLLQLSS